MMSDNGPAYLSRSFAVACKALGLKHIRIRAYTPRTNGKAKRFIQTLCKEWGYATALQNSRKSINWLPRDLTIYNRLRKHSALGGRSPRQRLNNLHSDERGETQQLGRLSGVGRPPRMGTKMQFS